MAVFQGRGGLEFIDVMRAGCVGLIPSAESCDVQARMFELLQSGAPRTRRQPSACTPSSRP